MKKTIIATVDERVLNRLRDVSIPKGSENQDSWGNSITLQALEAKSENYARTLETKNFLSIQNGFDLKSTVFQKKSISEQLWSVSFHVQRVGDEKPYGSFWIHLVPQEGVLRVRYSLQDQFPNTPLTSFEGLRGILQGILQAFPDHVSPESLTLLSSSVNMVLKSEKFPEVTKWFSETVEHYTSAEPATPPINKGPSITQRVNELVPVEETFQDRSESIKEVLLVQLQAEANVVNSIKETLSIPSAEQNFPVFHFLDKGSEYSVNLISVSSETGPWKLQVECAEKDHHRYKTSIVLRYGKDDNGQFRWYRNSQFDDYAIENFFWDVIKPLTTFSGGKRPAPFFNDWFYHKFVPWAIPVKREDIISQPVDESEPKPTSISSQEMDESHAEVLAAIKRDGRFAFSSKNMPELRFPASASYNPELIICGHPLEQAEFWYFTAEVVCKRGDAGVLYHGDTGMESCGFIDLDFDSMLGVYHVRESNQNKTSNNPLKFESLFNVFQYAVDRNCISCPDGSNGKRFTEVWNDVGAANRDKIDAWFQKYFAPHWDRSRHVISHQPVDESSEEEEHTKLLSFPEGELFVLVRPVYKGQSTTYQAVLALNVDRGVYVTVNYRCIDDGGCMFKCYVGHPQTSFGEVKPDEMADWLRDDNSSTSSRSAKPDQNSIGASFTTQGGVLYQICKAHSQEIWNTLKEMFYGFESVPRKEIMGNGVDESSQALREQRLVLLDQAWFDVGEWRLGVFLEKVEGSKPPTWVLSFSEKKKIGALFQSSNSSVQLVVSHNQKVYFTYWVPERNCHQSMEMKDPLTALRYSKSDKNEELVKFLPTWEGKKSFRDWVKKAVSIHLFVHREDNLNQQVDESLIDLITPEELKAMSPRERDELASIGSTRRFPRHTFKIDGGELMVTSCFGEMRTISEVFESMMLILNPTRNGFQRELGDQVVLHVVSDPEYDWEKLLRKLLDPSSAPFTYKEHPELVEQIISWVKAYILPYLHVHRSDIVSRSVDESSRSIITPEELKGMTPQEKRDLSDSIPSYRFPSESFDLKNGKLNITSGFAIVEGMGQRREAMVLFLSPSASEDIFGGWRTQTMYVFMDQENDWEKDLTDLLQPPSDLKSFTSNVRNHRFDPDLVARVTSWIKVNIIPYIQVNRSDAVLGKAVDEGLLSSIDAFLNDVQCESH
jgi:hypothetical protein